MSRTRLATANDAQGLAEMNAMFNEVQMEPSLIASKLREGKEIVAVALSGVLPVGFACAQVHDSICYPRPYGELTELFVKIGYRRKGFATSLVGSVEKQLAQRGVFHIHILTGVGNKPARALGSSRR